MARAASQGCSLTDATVLRNTPGRPSTQRPFDLDELPDLMERLGANLADGELARLRDKLLSLS